MSLYRRIRECLFGDSSDNSKSKLETDISESDPIEEVADEIEGLTPTDIEQIFLNMEHEPRVHYIERGVVPRLTWRKVSSYIRSDRERRGKWGLRGDYVIFAEAGGRKCSIHESIAELRTLSGTEEDTSTKSRSRSTQISEEIGADAKFLRANVGTSDSTKETSETRKSEQTSGSKQVWECGTGDKDCKLNRRSFIKAGDYYTTTGPTRAELLEEEFTQVAREAGVELMTTGDREEVSRDQEELGSSGSES